MARDTKRRMVETAVRLFQQEGYRGTSWRKLVEEAGTPWGSAHHFFPGGKEELGVAAIELGADVVEAMIEYSFAGASDAAAGVEAWFAAGAANLEQTAFRGGCPVATVALETSPQVEPLADACGDAFGRWEKAIERGLRRHGIERRRAARVAQLALAAFEGALVTSRARRSTKPLATAAALVAEQVRDG